MASRTTNTIRLGLFIIMATVIFIIGIYLIGNKQNLWGSTITLKTVFANVNGLKPGNNVRYSGIDVGTVSDIIFLTDSTLMVEMVINSKVQSFIKKDAIASIGSDGLVGNMLVNINPGNGQLSPVENGEIIQSYSRIEPDDILNTLGNTNENIALIANDLLAITQKINEGEGMIPVLLNDKTVAEDFRMSMTNIKTSTGQLASASDQIIEMLDQLQNGNGLIASLMNDTEVFSNVKAFAENLENLPVHKVDSILENLQAVGVQLTSFSSNLDAFMKDIQAGEGLIPTLLQDEAAADDLRSTLSNIRITTELLNQNLEAMRSNFLLKKYFKKQDKAARRAERDSLRSIHN